MVTLKLVAKLTDGSGNPLSGKTIEFYRSIDNVNFTLITTKTTDENGIAETIDEVTSYGTYYYKARFPGDGTYEASEDVEVYVYSIDWMQIMQQFLPWIIMVLFVVLLSVLLSAITSD